jgi:hypothetical protein
MAIIGGSSPVVGEVLSEYELQPTIIIQKEEIYDRQIEAALLEFVQRNVISLIGP